MNNKTYLDMIHYINLIGMMVDSSENPKGEPCGEIITTTFEEITEGDVQDEETKAISETI